MLLLLSELFAGPLRTKGGERVLEVENDRDSVFRGPAPSKERNLITFWSWRRPSSVFLQIKAGGMLYRLKILFVRAF